MPNSFELPGTLARWEVSGRFASLDLHHILNEDHFFGCSGEKSVDLSWIREEFKTSPIGDIEKRKKNLSVPYRLSLWIPKKRKLSLPEKPIMKNSSKKMLPSDPAGVGQPSRCDSFSSFPILTDIQVDSLSLLQKLQEHTRHQVAVTTLSSGSPPARTKKHSSSRRLASQVGGLVSNKLPSASAINKERGRNGGALKGKGGIAVSQPFFSFRLTNEDRELRR